jgi:hypothetical protein
VFNAAHTIRAEKEIPIEEYLKFLQKIGNPYNKGMQEGQREGGNEGGTREEEWQEGAGREGVRGGGREERVEGG